MIRWLHISDLHLGNDDMMSSRIRDKLLSFLTEKIGKVDYIFLTGDIRSANVPDNHFTEEMADFLKDICKHSGVGTDRLFIVPGNHDINREVPGRHDAIENVKFNWKGYYDPYSGKIKDEDLNAIWNGQEDLRNFLSLVYSPDQLSNYQNPNAPHLIIETNDFNIIHLDTTVTYTKDQEAHDLIIGSKYLYDALKNINKKKPSILLSHYPITSLLQDEKKVVSEMLRDFGVRLWLCGHEHDQNLQPYKYLHMLQSGEVQYEKSGRASFLVGEYDPDTFNCNVNAYEWYPEGWAKYPFVDRDGEREDTYTFELRPADPDCIPALTKKARKANESSLDRLTPNLDKNLICKISYEGRSVDLNTVLKSSWDSEKRNIILLGEGGMGKSTMILDFCKNASIPSLYISSEQLASLGIGLIDYCKLVLFDGNDTDFHKTLFDKNTHQSLILFVDGLNEVDSANEGRFINEIQRINLYKGVQIVIASRTDFTIRYNLPFFKKANIDKLTDDVLRAIFNEDEWTGIITSPNLHRLLRNPMLVTIYKEINSITDDFRDIDFLKWKLPVENPTDLFHNYYLAQIALMMKRCGASGEKILIAKVCIDQILPAIAYKYETTYSINKTNEDFRCILTDILENEKVNEKGLIEVRDQYRLRSELQTNYGIVSDMLIDELHLMHRDKHTTSFGHQMYRDYLSSRYIINKTDKGEQIIEIWNSRTFPLSVCRHIMYGSEKYWNGIAVNVKKVAEEKNGVLTLLENLFKCFPSSVNGGVADYSNLDLEHIQLPNLIPYEEKVSLKGSYISNLSIGINKKEGNPIHIICLSPDNKFLAVGIGSTIIIFDIHDNTEVFRYDIRKIPTQMIFYNQYLIVNAGVLIVFSFEDEWKYVGEIKADGYNIFNSKLQTIIASEDDLYIYYDNRHLIYSLCDCKQKRLEYKEHIDVVVVEGTCLINLRKAVNYKTAKDAIDGVTASAANDSLTAKAYADGRIEISNEGELISVLGERNTILLDGGISRDGSKAVTLSLEIFGTKRRIQIWDINRNLKTTELLCDSGIIKVHLSETGRWILGTTISSTWIYDTATNTEQWLDEFLVSNQHGKLITFGYSVMRKTKDGKLYLYDLSNGNIKHCKSPYKNPSMVYLLKNGHLAAVDRSGRSLRITVNRKGDTVNIHPEEYNDIIGVQEFKDQPFMVIAASNGLISVYHTRTGQRTRKLDNDFKIRLTTSHLNKTIMAHSDGRNRLTIDYYHEEIWNEYQRRGWWFHYPYKGKIDSRILDFAFNEQNRSLVVILANGKILFLSEDKCVLKGNAHIIVAFNTDAYDFSGVVCSKEIAETLKQNNCKCDNLTIKEPRNFLFPYKI